VKFAVGFEVGRSIVMLLKWKVRNIVARVITIGGLQVIDLQFVFL